MSNDCSKKEHSERVMSQAESEAEFISPFLDSELFSNTQILESENLNHPYESFQLESPFLNNLKLMNLRMILMKSRVMTKFFMGKKVM